MTAPQGGRPGPLRPPAPRFPPRSPRARRAASARPPRPPRPAQATTRASSASRHHRHVVERDLPPPASSCPARGPCPPPPPRRPPRRGPTGVGDRPSRRSTIASGPGRPGEDLATIASGSSEPRVVARDHDEVGQRGGRGTHERALAAVAVPAGPEDRDDAVGSREPPGRRQDVLEPVGRVRVVHQDREVLARVDGLEAARALAPPAAAPRRSRRRPRRAPAPGRRRRGR
jgi:hypothetical protein